MCEQLLLLQREPPSLNLTPGTFAASPFVMSLNDSQVGVNESPGTRRPPQPRPFSPASSDTVRTPACNVMCNVRGRGAPRCAMRRDYMSGANVRVSGCARTARLALAAHLPMYPCAACAHAPMHQCQASPSARVRQAYRAARGRAAVANEANAGPEILRYIECARQLHHNLPVRGGAEFLTRSKCKT